MKILADYEDLVGKKIAFSHMAQFADQITLATEDGCVLMATMSCEDEWGENKEVRVLSKVSVMRELENNEWMREQLSEAGVFDLERYKEEQRIKTEKENEERRLRFEKREREEYERLKAKFG